MQRHSTNLSSYHANNYQLDVIAEYSTNNVRYDRNISVLLFDP